MAPRAAYRKALIQNFLGPTGPLGPSLWVDSAGTPFSLLGLDTASILKEQWVGI